MTEPKKRTTEQRGFDKLGKISNRSEAGKGLIDRLFGRWINVPGSKDWVVDAEWAKIQQNPIKTTRLLYTVIISVLILVTWAAFAEVATIARGDGKVVPSSQLQTIETFDGGLIEKIHVSEGQLVSKGDVLVELDSTRFFSEFNENQSRMWALQADNARLRALVNGAELEFPNLLSENAPVLVKDTISAYKSNLESLKSRTQSAEAQLRQRKEDLNELQAALKQYRESLALVERELAVTRPLKQSGAVSEVDIIRLERDQTQFRGQINQTLAAIENAKAAIDESENRLNEVRLEKINEWRRELSEVSADLAAFESVKSRLSDKVQQSKLRSPVGGIVQKLHVNTVGGVVTTGQPVVDIVPVNDELIIQARILPKDIAFIKKGQEAMIKFTSYDFSVFGGAKATVSHISADTVTDDDDVTYYIVRLKTSKSEFSEELQIIPGMVAQVDIKTGERTILNYLLKPLMRAKSEALTER